MLVLALKPGESCVIGPDIRVIVTEVRRRPGGDCVKLGIIAPRHVSIVRSELLEVRRGDELERR